MSIDTFPQGQYVRIEGTFRDVDEVLSDPTTVTLVVIDPSGNEDTYTYSGGQITKDSVGVYFKDIQADEAGDWYCEWQSTGTAQTAEPVQFYVEASRT